MYIDNITSKGVTLNSAGKSMQIEVYEKEIVRLNNIINELEKWLKEYKIQCKKYDSNSTIVIINGILDKLKELKEGIK